MDQKVPSQQGLASIPAAAEFLSLSRGKTYQMINAGQIPSKRFGKSVRIPWSWLLQQAAVASDSDVL
jgi:excisionase family DNA binding protein